MNKKIFTLLATALLLFTTAYSAYAWPVSDKVIGAPVTTLPDGRSVGMYHIVVDEIYMHNGSDITEGWYPVTWNGNPGMYLQYFDNGPGQPGTYRLEYYDSTNPADTIVVAVSEAGEAWMISMNHLKDEIEAGTAFLLDLQSTMWCTDVEDPAVWGQWPTYHFTNKVFDLDLDYPSNAVPYLGVDRGWMFSQSYLNGQLKRTMPFYRHVTTGQYRVVTAKFTVDAANGANQTDTTKFMGTASANNRIPYSTTSGTNWPDGRLFSRNQTIERFTDQVVPGMLKFSIHLISPMVLTAEDFNTKLGSAQEGLVKLLFNPEPTIESYFEYELKAIPSESQTAVTGVSLATPGFAPDATGSTFVQPANTVRMIPTTTDISDQPAAYGYLNVQVYKDGQFLGYIGNDNRNKSGTNSTSDKYENINTVEYLKIKVYPYTTTLLDEDGHAGGYNNSYRFVYFPSEDSLVINAFFVKHDRHAEFQNNWFKDNDSYHIDVPPAIPYKYGLYNDYIQEALIVRLQDLSGLGMTRQSLMTIGKHPANTRLSFGVNCDENLFDVWQPSRGVYTIWDTRGRALGIRIYNGSYTPQWLELAEGECPDRIPSYQWVVEIADNGDSNSRINITSREFGDLTPESSSALVQMLRVLVRKDPSKIFRQQSQFKYHPLIPQISFWDNAYEPITEGLVAGAYVDPVAADECNIGGRGYPSGFRPVTRQWVNDAYLGYKHFEVEKSPTSPSYGKSEKMEGGKGMDYNAYAFRYLHYQTEEGYIHTKDSWGERILNISLEQKTGFQFMLGTYLRTHQFEEEIYGYPRTQWTNVVINWPERRGTTSWYTQGTVPVLRRYYYELKEANFYLYRDNLADQYVVLKGAKEDNSDIKNAMKYGLADVWADKDPFKFANVYLRESFFLVRPNVGDNEERPEADPSRRIYYVLLDRIEAEQLAKVTSYGYEVSDTLMGEDGTTKYNLVAVGVDDHTGEIEALGKTSSYIRVYPFSLENMSYELYRRLRSIRDDGANEEGAVMDVVCEPDYIEVEKSYGYVQNANLDAPKVLRFYRDYNPAELLYEDALSANSANYGINYLGVGNIFPDAQPERLAPDGTVKYNYNLFVDTAFINRGTGPIKPQYLLAVGVTNFCGEVVRDWGYCDRPIDYVLTSYISGRYLINATDSARYPSNDGSVPSLERDKNYLFATSWVRLAFVEAIHADDNLYILSEVDKYMPRSAYTTTLYNGTEIYDAAALLAATKPGGALYGRERRKERSDLLGAYYNFANWDNYHNDVSFSLRFRQQDVKNPNEFGIDTYSNDDKRFYIESETTNRNIYGNYKIAPTQGGWIKLQNGIPVISDQYEDAIQNGEVFNVDLPNDWQDGRPTKNENSYSSVSVTAGDGVVTILNAAGKQVTITNMLGQTVVSKALAGNSETLTVSKGMAVVTVEGEKTAKVIVK